MATEPCATCYGTGEHVTDQGPAVCPDCFGEGVAPGGHGSKLEWRLREIERRLAATSPGADLDADVRWLIHEVRRTRETLVHILARCQDADDNDALAADVKFRANAALGLYEEQ